MKQLIAYLLTAWSAMLSCGTSRDDAGGTADVAGTYVREYAFEVKHVGTGEVVGMCQVRDSIFIERSDKRYMISNRKWRMNDYDQDGWVNIAHSESRPLPTFVASYDEELGVLAPENARFLQPIFVDGNRLFRDTEKRVAYQRIE